MAKYVSCKVAMCPCNSGFVRISKFLRNFVQLQNNMSLEIIYFGLNTSIDKSRGKEKFLSADSFSSALLVGLQED